MNDFDKRPASASEERIGAENRAPERRPYAAPVLTQLGDIVEMTRAAAGSPGPDVASV